MMKYPVWFPFPICWLRSLLVMVQSQIAVFAVMLAFLITSLPAALTSMAHESAMFFWLVVWVIGGPLYLLAQCDRLIWHRPKPPHNFFSWFPGLKSWGEGAFAYGGFVISAIPVVFVYVLQKDTRYTYRPTPTELTWSLVAIFILLAYVYHLRLLFNRQLGAEFADLGTRWANRESRLHRWLGQTPKRRQRTTTTKPKPTQPTKPKPPTDPIEAELEELRRRMEGRE